MNIGQVFRPQFELYDVTLPCLYIDMPDVAQDAYRLRDAGDAIMNIELRDFMLGTLSAVGEGGAHQQCFALVDGMAIQLGGPVGYGRISQTMTKGEQRLVRHFQIARLVRFLRWIRLGPSGRTGNRPWGA